jgi:uncharacterized OB-fold protein
MATEQQHPVVDKREEWAGPVPNPNGVTTEFWEATLDGRFMIQYCPQCDEHQFYPRVICSACGELYPEWVDAAGSGKIYSYAVNHAPAGKGFTDLVPYVVAVIELNEGVRMVAMVDADSDTVEIGDRVSIELWRISDDAAFPVFVPAVD